MATLKEVADLAGVSTATASLALNNGPVNEKTRQRVVVCARQINYVPNAIGRSLTTGHAYTIQLLTLTSDRHADTVRKTSLFHYILDGMLSVATSRKYGVRFDVKSHQDLDLVNYFERLVGEGTVDGVAIIPQFKRRDDFIQPILRENFPYVLLQPKQFGPNANFVDMGNYSGGQAVAELFVNGGGKRIVFINGPEQHLDSIERERGFRDGMAVANPDSLKVWYGDYTIQSGYAAMSEILKHKCPDSVFCGNDYMAAGAIRRLYEAGIRVPEDVAVVGFDDSDICLGIYPPLTSVNNRFLDLGRALAECLLDQIEGHMVSCQKVFTPTVVERETHRRSLHPLRKSAAAAK